MLVKIIRIKRKCQCYSVEILGKMEKGMGTAIIRHHFCVNKLTIYHITEYEDMISQNATTSDPPKQMLKEAFL
jgi:hypothetical protein